MHHTVSSSSMATVSYCYFYHFQPFLKMYQVDKPRMSFLVPDLPKLVKDLLARFV